MTTTVTARTLDSFADETITCARQSDNGLWYAILDVGPDGYVGDPDFVTCRDTREQAVAACAATIRADAVGVGVAVSVGVGFGVDVEYGSGLGISVGTGFGMVIIQDFKTNERLKGQAFDLMFYP